MTFSRICFSCFFANDGNQPQAQARYPEPLRSTNPRSCGRISLKMKSSECGALRSCCITVPSAIVFVHSGLVILVCRVMYPVLVCQDGFVHTLGRSLPSPFCARTLLCQIVDTKNHILGRNGYRTTIGRFQQVVRRKKHETALCLCFYRQRQMDSHLVTVEVGVECGTNQRMQLNRFTFYQDRLERLDTQTMQCRGTVQHNRMLFDDVLENVPYLRLEVSRPFSLHF